MSEVKHILEDTIDTSFEMPPQYSSRFDWSYNQIMGWVAVVALPILLLAELVGPDTAVGRVLTYAFVLVGVATGIFLALGARAAQKRIDRTGTPLVEREPY